MGACGTCCSRSASQPSSHPPFTLPRRITSTRKALSQPIPQRIVEIDNKEKEREQVKPSNLVNTDVVENHMAQEDTPCWTSSEGDIKGVNMNEEQKVGEADGLPKSDEIEVSKEDDGMEKQTVQSNSSVYDDEKISASGDSAQVKSLSSQPPGFQSIEDLARKSEEVNSEVPIFQSDDSTCSSAVFDDNTELTLNPMVRFVSEVADQIEDETILEEGECLGIKSWQLCWLRGDEGNAPTDYQETIYITEELMGLRADRARSSPLIPTKSMRDLKKDLADAYLDAVPSCRRQLSLVTLGVDKIWNDVTKTRRGKLVLCDQRYKKELAWLRSKRRISRHEDARRDSLIHTSRSSAKLSLHCKTGVVNP